MKNLMDSWQDLDIEPWREYNIISPSREHLAWSEDEDDYSDDEDYHMPKSDYQTQGPTEVDGYKVYEMSSNEYPEHDAIWIDRENRTIVINYQGHHAPLFDAFSDLMPNAGYPQVAGHFRQAPSSTEPYPAGWGWHGYEASPEEKQIIKKVLKNHYQVEKLNLLYKDNPEAEENFFQEAKIEVSTRNQVEWLDDDHHTLTWKGIYDILGKKMYLWSASDYAPHHSDIINRIPVYDWRNTVELEGNYLKPSWIGTDDIVNRAKALEVLVPALHERWPEGGTD